MENKEINDILSGAYAQARADFIPVCSHFCRNLLCDLARQTDPERILEIGTAVGYSAACMALACRARVDTADIDGERLARAQKLWRRLGTEERISAFCGDVRLILPQIMAGKKYGLVFLDGPKSACGELFEAILPHLEKGGIIVTDDINYLGLVRGDFLPPHKHRTIVLNMRRFVRHISEPPFETRIYWEEGVAVTKISGGAR